jgi:hypothetical protein
MFLRESPSRRDPPQRRGQTTGELGSGPGHFRQPGTPTAVGPMSAFQPFNRLSVELSTSEPHTHLHCLLKTELTFVLTSGGDSWTLRGQASLQVCLPMQRSLLASVLLKAGPSFSPIGPFWSGLDRWRLQLNADTPVQPASLPSYATQPACLRIARG